MEGKNILVVSHEYLPIGGGGANACMNLTKNYGSAGCRVTIVTTWYAGLLEEERVGKVRIIRVKSKRKHLEHCSFTEMFDYLFKALKVTSKLAKNEHFDICQVFLQSQVVQLATI